MKTRLGKRLTALLAAIPPSSERVWDLCCDHGALGRALLEQRSNCHVVFNDIHPGIMERLAALLVKFNAKNYALNVGPAQHITPQRGANTFVLAGIGDEQSIAILQHLISQPDAIQHRYIVSPATKVAHVRQFLIAAGFRLLAESVVSENGRSYEILNVCIDQNAGREMSVAMGDDIGNAWSVDPQQGKHLAKLLDFYRGQLRNNPDSYAKHLVERYQQVLNVLSTQTMKPQSLVGTESRQR